MSNQSPSSSQNDLTQVAGWVELDHLPIVNGSQIAVGSSATDAELNPHGQKKAFPSNFEIRFLMSIPELLNPTDSNQQDIKEREPSLSEVKQPVSKAQQNVRNSGLTPING